MKNMSALQLGWVVGIIEGEGSIMWTAKTQPRVAVTMTDLDIIERLAEYTGLGTVSGPYDIAGGTKPAWTWQVGAQADFVALTATLRPYLGKRRVGQLDAVLSSLEQHLQDKAARRAASFNPGTGTCRNGHNRAVEGVLRGTNKCLRCHRDRSRKARQ